MCIGWWALHALQKRRVFLFNTLEPSQSFFNLVGGKVLCRLFWWGRPLWWFRFLSSVTFRVLEELVDRCSCPDCSVFDYYCTRNVVWKKCAVCVTVLVNWLKTNWWLIVGFDWSWIMFFKGHSEILLGASLLFGPRQLSDNVLISSDMLPPICLGC